MNRVTEICLSGPPRETATREVLAAAAPHAIVVWAVKADPRAVPPDLAAVLATRADILVSSRREAGFVHEAFERAGVRRSPPVRIETRGGEGVAILGEGSETLVSVETFKANDTTGAGDTFLGGFLAAWRAGEVEANLRENCAALFWGSHVPKHVCTGVLLLGQCRYPKGRLK